MDKVFFYRLDDELPWRSSKPWHGIYFSFDSSVDLHKVWNYLHTLEGYVGLRRTNDEYGLSNHGINYSMQFSDVVAKTNFEMFAKLSNWQDSTPSSPDWTNLLSGSFSSGLVSKSYVTKVLGLPPLDPKDAK